MKESAGNCSPLLSEAQTGRALIHCINSPPVNRVYVSQIELDLEGRRLFQVLLT